MQANKTSGIFSYEGPLAIVGAGEVDTALLWRFWRERTAIIAADGGANICAEKRIIPDAIIGDMDSIANREYWQDKTRLVEVKEQETTDFEKCLQRSEAPVTIAIGMAGERVDHTLANLDILLRYGSGRRLAIATKEDLIIRVKGACEFDGLPGSRVSVLPVTPIRFLRSMGLEYSLDGLEMAPGQRVGVSNRSETGRFLIEPEEGFENDYLLVLDRMNLEIWTRDDTLAHDDLR